MNTIYILTKYIEQICCFLRYYNTNYNRLIFEYLKKIDYLFTKALLAIWRPGRSILTHTLSESCPEFTEFFDSEVR